METLNLNHSPNLTMEQITKQLFNNQFMSDIQFRVEGKVVFAHSWELMKRSIVFCEQFKGNLGDIKLITIEDFTYVAFLEFVRFIYTDECKIQMDTICEMFELARRYKILKLETKLLNLWTSWDTDIKLLEYSYTNNYELIYNNMFDRVIYALDFIIDKDSFLKINSHLLEEILKSNQMPSKITEVKLFDALVRWMHKSCEINQLPITQCRINFDKLLRLIRFPTMTTEELYRCVKNHPDILTSEDTSAICQKIILRDQCKYSKWQIAPRLKYSEPYEELVHRSGSKWFSKFTVSNSLILYGLRCGSGSTGFKIEITGQFGIKKNKDVLRFSFEDSQTRYNTVSLGESIKLKPNVDYTIGFKYENPREIFGRKRDNNLIVTGPSDLVSFTETSKALFEIFFKLPTN